MAGQEQRESDLDWWLRDPALLQAELEAFDAHGAEASILFQEYGSLILAVRWPTERGALDLRVGFCPTHPCGRPSVATADLTLSRHQDPFSGTLCLLTQETGQWLSGETAAELIAAQLPRAIEASAAHEGARAAEAAGLEEHAPDPLTTYFSHQCDRDSVVLYDADLRAPPGDWGPAGFSVRDRPTGGTEIILRTLKPTRGLWMANPFEPWPETSPVSAAAGRWVRLRPQATADLESLAKQAAAIIARDETGPRSKASRGKTAKAPGTPELTVILFDEEVEYGRQGPACLFLFRGPDAKLSLLRGHRIAPDLLARSPVSAGLRVKQALLVGAGAIGGFVALELVRAGLGRLDVTDGDCVEPGNSVRWALGREYWGRPKAHALADHAMRHYPLSQVHGYLGRVGGALNNPDHVRELGGHPLEWLRERVLAADVVLDATASVECQMFLQWFCRRHGRPYIFGHATQGAVGGVVARFDVDGSACRGCLGEHWTDGTLPEPVEDPAGVLTPVGCNQPTFTGGAFDLQEVSMEMVRTALGVLVPDLYPRGGGGLGVVDLEINGRRATPRWTVSDIPSHPRCGCAR